MKAIFFDAADTLFRVRGGVGEVYARVARRFGAQPDAAAIERAFARAFRSAPPLAFPGATDDSIERLEKEWWRRLVTEVFEEIGMFPRFAEYFNALFEAFRGIEAWELFPETVPTLEALKHRGLYLGIISNFDSRIFDVLSALGIERFFDSVTISSRAGSAKPAKAIFLVALEQAQVKAASALHVGDSLREDVEGARAAGLKALLLDRQGRFRLPDPPAIATLDQLLSMLD